jgi:hypothetical protein
LKKVLIYIALVLLFVQCRKEVFFKTTNSEVVLVVDAILTNDSLFLVKLSQTQAINDNSLNRFVSDASIEVFDKDSNIISVLNYNQNGRYISSLVRAVPNEAYIFKITHQNKVYWANQAMPDTLKTSVLDTNRLVFQGVSQFFQIKFSFQDQSLLSNYYGLKVKAFFETVNNQDTNIISEWLPIETNDFILVQDPKTRYSKTNLLFTDQYLNGQNKELIFGCANLFNTQNKKVRFLVVYSSSLSIAAYQYFTSINEHLFYKNDPFSLPPPLQGNVAGAYGGVAAQYMKADTIRFK